MAIDLVASTPLTFAIDVRPLQTAAVDTKPGETVVIVPVPGVPGTRGPVGPAGDGGFTYVQGAPAATWTITTPLGRLPASVSIFVGGELVDADVAVPDLATVVVTFASPQSGRAEIS
jgi:hypothetical protein